MANNLDSSCRIDYEKMKRNACDLHVECRFVENFLV